MTRKRLSQLKATLLKLFQSNLQTIKPRFNNDGLSKPSCRQPLPPIWQQRKNGPYSLSRIQVANNIMILLSLFLSLASNYIAIGGALKCCHFELVNISTFDGNFEFLYRKTNLDSPWFLSNKHLIMNIRSYIAHSNIDYFHVRQGKSKGLILFRITLTHTSE